MNRLRARYVRWREETYPKYAAGMVAFALFTAIVASVGVVWLTKVQGDETDRREKANATILACFDEYAEDQVAYTTVLRPFNQRVSEAQSSVSAAQSAEAAADLVTTRRARARGQALTDLISYVSSGGTDPVVAQDLFVRLLEQQSALVKAEDVQAPLQEKLVRAYGEQKSASDALIRARDRNPIPEAPSVNCEIDPATGERVKPAEPKPSP